MEEYRRTVGNVELISLTDGQGSGYPTDIFPGSDLSIWRTEYRDLIDSAGLIHPRYGSVAVRSGGNLIVVDTGVGPPDGKMLEDMHNKGVSRDAVDLVVTTHLHADHIGWNLINGEPTFPNARYLVPKEDWDYWTGVEVIGDFPIVGVQALPLDGLNILDLIEGEYCINDELTAVPTPGHTPGHISIAIVSAGRKGFILGDVVHSPSQASHTDWNPSFDVDPVLARQTRHSMLDRLENDRSLVSVGHFPAPGFGMFVRNEGQRYWQIA